MDKSLDFNLLLRSELQDFIKQHESDDESALVLRHKDIYGLPAADIAQQIAGRKKAKNKLPLFYNTPDIVYPPSLNLEQCSSESTARFKARLFSGHRALDLTGGTGVDSFFLSRSFEEVIYVEKNEALLQLTVHNHSVLGAKNITHHCQDAASFIASSSKKLDLIYIDPSRRSASNKKVFRFAECSPDVVSLLPTLLTISGTILIKASPLIDIKQGIKELGHVSRVYVVGYNNECKEILFLVNSNVGFPALIEAIDLSPDDAVDRSISFKHNEEAQAEVTYAEPETYLYEPNAMILKAGAFKLVATKYGLKKIAPNTHLYTSSEVVNSFPGKIYKVENYLKSNPKSVAALLPSGKANIITRNYPLTPAQVKSKLKLKDGGESFVIGFSGTKKKYLALAKRIR